MAAAARGRRLRPPATLEEAKPDRLTQPRPFLRSQVIRELPLLVASSDPPPPLAVFSPLEADVARCELLPDDADDIAPPAVDPDLFGGRGEGAWPTHSAFDNTHLGLVLAFANAAADARVAVLRRMQSAIDDAGPGGAVSAAALCCRQAAAHLASRGGPWDVSTWELEREVVALCPPEALLERLLSILTVNAHAFRGGAALFDVATKLAHTCGAHYVDYRPTATHGVFVASRDVPAGALLTTSYLSAAARRASTIVRRRLLFCQKGEFGGCIERAEILPAVPSPWLARTPPATPTHPRTLPHPPTHSLVRFRVHVHDMHPRPRPMAPRRGR